MRRDKEYLEEYKKELEGTIYYGEEVEIYAQLRLEGMTEVGAIEALNSFSVEELKAISSFRRLYGHYFSGGKAEQYDEVTLEGSE